MRRTIYVREEDDHLFETLAQQKRLSEVCSKAIREHFNTYSGKEPIVLESRDPYKQPTFQVYGHDEWFIVIQTHPSGPRVERRGIPPNIEDIKEMRAWLKCLEAAEKRLEDDRRRIDSNP